MTILKRENGPDVVTEGDYAEKRWESLARFGLDRPSGDMKRDLEGGKKLLFQRGINIQEVRSMPDMGPGVIQFIASTDGVKRDGNEVVNTGWNFHGFDQNPAFLWSHDYRSLPIGRHVDRKVDILEGGGSVLRTWVQFVEDETYPFAERVRKMYEQGFLRAVSIGWNPISWEYRVNEDGEIAGYRFTENDLLEVSAVSVPSDPDAIVEAINKRVLNSEDVELMARSGALPKLSRKIAYTLSNFEPFEAEVRTEEATEMAEPNEVVDKETPAEAEVTEERAEDAEKVETSATDEATGLTEDQEKAIETIEASAKADAERTEEEVVNPVEEADDDDETPDPTDTLRKAVGEAANSFADDLVRVIGKALGRDFGIDYVDEPEGETAAEVTDKEEERTVEVEVEIDGEKVADVVADPETERSAIDSTLERFKELNEAIDIAEGRLGNKLSKKTRSTLGSVSEALERAQEGINSLLETTTEVADPEEASAEDVAETRSEDEVVAEEVVEPELDMDELERKLSGLSRELGVPDEDDVLGRLTEIAGDFAPQTRGAEPETPEEPKSEFVSDLFDKLDILKKEF